MWEVRGECIGVECRGGLGFECRDGLYYLVLGERVGGSGCGCGEGLVGLGVSFGVIGLFRVGMFFWSM